MHDGDVAWLLKMILGVHYQCAWHILWGCCITCPIPFQWPSAIPFIANPSKQGLASPNIPSMINYQHVFATRSSSHAPSYGSSLGLLQQHGTFPLMSDLRHSRWCSSFRLALQSLRSPSHPPWEAWQGDSTFTTSVLGLRLGIWHPLFNVHPRPFFHADQDYVVEIWKSDLLGSLWAFKTVCRLGFQ